MRATLLVLMGIIVGVSVMLIAVARENPNRSSYAMETAQAAGEDAGAAIGPDDLLEEADLYDREADHIQAEVMEYKRKAASITPLTDTKGIRRSGLLTAAGTKSKAVAELRQLAAHHRNEAKRMMAASPSQ
jgi:hypothetical protein